jgi:biopolymer transport protein TolR
MSFSSDDGDDGDGPEALSEINVTPLVDVMLVLLIIFMVTAPMMTTGMKVDLPQARASAPLDQQPLVLTVAADGTMQVGNDAVAKDGLVVALKAKMANPTQVVHVRGDKKVPYGDIAGLLDMLAQNGITRLSLVANVKSGG